MPARPRDPPTLESARSPSLPGRAEEEAHEQHVRLPARGQWTEDLEASRLLDRSLGFDVVGKASRSLDELQIGDRAVAVNEERDLHIRGRGAIWPLPAPQDLRHDVLQVLRVR